MVALAWKAVLVLTMAAGAGGSAVEVDESFRTGKPIKIPPKVVKAPLATGATGRQLP